MPAITFNWKGPFTPRNVSGYQVDAGDQLIKATWINVVEWRDATRALMGTGQGIYIVEDGVDSPVYAGKAINLRKRFTSRSNSLHELSLDSGVLPNYRVRVASILVSPQNYLNKLDWAERWLVRFLFRRDQAHAPNQQLQNLNLTAPFQAPVDGDLEIHFDGDIPSYLRDPNAPGFKRPRGSSDYYYTYGAGTTVLA